MKIEKVTEDSILFDNGNTIDFDHRQDCCEHNYADFSQLEDSALSTEFDEDLVFEAVNEAGFRFGNEDKMFFVPCYTEQNGYYSDDVDIYYNKQQVLNVITESR